jgi:putative ABC transport system permease protein
VRWHGEPLEAEVAGVVGPLRHDGLRSPPRAEVFVPHAQVPFGSMTYVVRTRRDAEALMHAAKEAIWAEDPLQAFYQTTTMEQLVAESVRPQRFSLTLLGAFAALALVLAAAGIFGVMSFTAEQRKREIGIRIALGARGRDILRLLVGEGMALALLGIALGLCSALGLSRFLSSLLHGVEPTDPPTLAAVCALLGAVALAACYLPARRALRNDPISVLRIE